MSTSTEHISEEEKDRLRSIPIVSVLADFGFNTWHTRHSLYFSPFHNEKTPSFHIDEKLNRWFDWSSADPNNKNGGDVFKLVMQLKRCGFNDAVAYLRQFRPDLTVDYSKQILDEPAGGAGVRTAVSPIEIYKVTRPIQSRILRHYMTQKRCIPEPLLDRYCSQINYRRKLSDGSVGDYFCIGFPNINGDWALRDGFDPKDPTKGNYTKKSTGQNFSVITADGRLANEITKEQVVLIEGFTSALSLFALKSVLAPTVADVIVLNSVTNSEKAVERIAGAGCVRSVLGYLDNDPTGETYTKFFARQLSERGIAFRDGRANYRGFNDLNDLLKAKRAAAAAKSVEMDGKTENRVPERVESPVWNAVPHQKR